MLMNDDDVVVFVVVVVVVVVVCQGYVIFVGVFLSLSAQCQIA